MTELEKQKHFQYMQQELEEARDRVNESRQQQEKKEAELEEVKKDTNISTPMITFGCNFLWGKERGKAQWGPVLTTLSAAPSSPFPLSGWRVLTLPG